MTRLEFEKTVEACLSQIPRAYKHYFDNLTFVIEDRPDAELLSLLGSDCGEDLLGFYHGYPLDERSHNLQPLTPDIIYLFQKAIEEEALSQGYPVSRVVFETLLHEVAHFFGFNEEQVERIESYW